MLARTAMSSFSDAHELVEIPIIAANLHRLMLPRQSQIWAVLHRTDSDRRLLYSLAATFLGRMCLSGEIDALSSEQWALVVRAQQLYRHAAYIIKNGTSRHFGSLGASWRHPQGWQAVVRAADDGRAALVVLHAFATAPAHAEIALPNGKWRMVDRVIGPLPVAATVADGTLKLTLEGDFSAQVLLLEKI